MGGAHGGDAGAPGAGEGEGLSSIDFGVGYTTLRFPFEIVSGDPNGSPGSACSNDPNGTEEVSDSLRARERARHLQPSDGKVEFKLRDLTLQCTGQNLQFLR